jgi:hypothetical protein
MANFVFNSIIKMQKSNDFNLANLHCLKKSVTSEFFDDTF